MNSAAGGKATTVVTIGHGGHGKTTLSMALRNVQALQGRDPVAFYVPLDCPPALADLPKVITECGGLGIAILVVSAEDGPMPQTREHILLVRQVPVTSIVAFLNKVDAVGDKDLLDLMEQEVRDLLTKYGYQGIKIQVIRGSALKAAQATLIGTDTKSVEEVLEALDALTGREKNRPGQMEINVQLASPRTAVSGDETVVITDIGESHLTLPEIMAMGKLLKRSPGMSQGEARRAQNPKIAEGRARKILAIREVVSDLPAVRTDSLLDTLPCEVGGLTRPKAEALVAVVTVFGGKAHIAGSAGDVLIGGQT